MNADIDNDTLERELEKLERLARWMDSQFSIPGTSIRFGFDSLLGLIPGLGDTGTLAVTLYLSEKAKSFGLPRRVRLRMFWNAFIDWLIGLVPLAGDLFDLGWKANLRNIELMRHHIGKSANERR